MALNRIYQTADLAPGLPADQSVTARTRMDRRSWVWGFNLSPYIFEIQDEGGSVITLAMPFAPFKQAIDKRTEKVILHGIATWTTANPIANTAFAFYIDVTEFEPQPIAAAAL